MAKQLLVSSMVELLETMPVSVLGALVFIGNLAPDSVQPLAKSVVSHLLITAVHQGREERVVSDYFNQCDFSRSIMAK